jgi:hypothetical protein
LGQSGGPLSGRAGVACYSPASFAAFARRIAR